jgi:two-component system, NtrC family, sensor kinase
VSRPMWLRHKLRLVLFLVVASISLLVGGIIIAYISSQKVWLSTKRKHDEIAWLNELQREVDNLSNYSVDVDDEMKSLEEGLKTIRTKKEFIREELVSYTQPRKLDPDNCESELAILDAFDATFIKLETAINQDSKNNSGTITSERSKRIIDQSEASKYYRKLKGLSIDLINVSRDDVTILFDGSRSTFKKILLASVAAAALALVLTLTMLYYFRVWIFTPIRQIQAGVLRVHQGEFNKPIQLKSQDELEELANEFNSMTVRLRDIYQDLAQQVDARSKQLVRSERLISVGFLAAGVSHEINNPLASIAFCAEALERRVIDIAAKAPEEADVLAKYLRMIQQEAFRCKEITLKLLDFSRTGGQRETTDLAQLIHDVVEMAKHLQNARGKNVRFIPEQAIYAPVNSRDIKSVVLNLVVNALDSMDQGGTLNIGLNQKDNSAILSFTDTGCGMTKEVLDNIFEPFFTRNRTGNGTGLGLSISHRIIHQHGGSIGATSEGPGYGSMFTVQLPITAENSYTPDIEPAATIPFPQLRPQVAAA